MLSLTLNQYLRYGSSVAHSSFHFFTVSDFNHAALKMSRYVDDTRLYFKAC